MKKLLVLLVLLVVLTSQIQAAKVLSFEDNSQSSNKHIYFTIGEEYAGMGATVIGSGGMTLGNGKIKIYLYNPSGNLLNESINSNIDAGGGTNPVTVTLVQAVQLELGQYATNVVLTKSTDYGPFTVLVILWDAPGQEVIDLKAELKADIATARSELEGEINTKTADLQSQINTKAQELSDLAAKHDADQTVILGQIVANTSKLALLEQQHDDDNAAINQEITSIKETITTLEGKLDSEILAVYTELNTLNAILDAFILETRNKQDQLTEQITALNTVITERLRRLENRVKLAVYATTKLTEMKTTTEANIIAKQAEIVQLDLEIQALEDAGQDASAKIALRNIALDEYARLQIDLEDIVAAIDLRENDSEFAALRAEIVSLNSITAAMDARIVELEGLVVILKKSIEDGDDELHAKIDAQIALLRQEIMDKIDKDIYETSQHFDDLRQMIKDISDAQSTSTPTGSFDSPDVDSLTVPVDTRDMRVSPDQTI